MELSSRIQALRKSKGLSQEALADRLGVSRQAIGKWESGQAVPSIDNLLELSELFDVTLDYLLTGKAPSPAPHIDALSYEEAPDSELPGQASGETVSLDALRQLLVQQPKAHRPRTAVIVACCLVLALVLGLSYWFLSMATTRINTMAEQIYSLDTRMDTIDQQIETSLSGFQYRLQETLAQQESLLTTADIGPGEFDPETYTAKLTVSATLKVLTTDTKVRFALLPMTSSQDTLDSSLNMKGSDAVGAGTYTATFDVPMVQDFVVIVVVEQDGTSQTEIIQDYYDFSSLYLSTLECDTNDFSYSISTGNIIRISGSPAVSVNTAFSASAPKPKTLITKLYIDEEEVYSDQWPIEEDFAVSSANGEQAIAPSSNITYYPGHMAGNQSYSGSSDSILRWEFILVDTDGNEQTASLSYP